MHQRRCEVQSLPALPQGIAVQGHTVEVFEMIHHIGISDDHGIRGGFWRCFDGRRPPFHLAFCSSGPEGLSDAFGRGFGFVSELGHKKSAGVVVIVPESQTPRELFENCMFRLLFTNSFLHSTCRVKVGRIKKRQCLNLLQIHTSAGLIQERPTLQAGVQGESI